MFKYSRMQKKIPSRLVCGSRGAYLVNMFPGVQVTAGLGLFSQVIISSEDSDSPAVYGGLFPSSGVPSGIVL